jgi:hypothetical protein
VQQAANEYRPLVMAAYAYELANAFHSFYHAVPVLQSEDENVKTARLRWLPPQSRPLPMPCVCSISRRPRSCRKQAKRYLYV